MLYENYKKKLKVIAIAISVVVKTLPIIFISIAVAVTIALSLAVAMGSVGSVGSVSCPNELIYGEQIECKAFGLLTRVTYEYCKVGTDEWTTEVPTKQGEYQVRAVGTTVLGTNRYSAQKTITILPKEIKVFVSEESVIYGEMPALRAELLEGETILCDSFSFADVTATKTNVTPDKGSIKIFNESGEDITDCYSVVVVSKEVNVLQRPIVVTVEDYTATYNGKECSFNKFEISEGSLKDGDTLSGTFDSKIIDVGSIENEPGFKVLNSDGKDVTHLYDLDVQNGKLTVEKRPLILVTQGFESVYNGEEQYLSEYIVGVDTPLAEGHQIVVLSYGKYKNAGQYTNAMAFKIVDENGDDKSNNYSVTVVEGEVKIGKKQLTVTTPSETWVYDGIAHYSYKGVSGEGLVNGHKILASVSFPIITDTGIVENKFAIAIMDEDQAGYVDDITPLYEPAFDYDLPFEDLSQNYEITYVYGTLEVTKRVIKVRTQGNLDAVYNGDVQQFMDFEVLTDYGDGSVAPGQRFEVISTTPFEDVNIDENGDAKAVDNKILKYIIYYESDGNKKDLSQNYTVEFDNRQVKINFFEIYVTTYNNSWIYDGITHSCKVDKQDGFGNSLMSVSALAGSDKYEVVSCPEVNGYTETAVKNEVKLYIYKVNSKGEKVDKTANYIVHENFGTLSVTKRVINIETETNLDTIYDGKVHTFTDPKKITVTCLQKPGEGLAANHKLVVEKSTSLTYATEAECDNVYETYKIVDKEGVPVTDNYVISFTIGRIKLQQRPVIVKTKSLSHVYDATEVSQKGWDYSKNSKYDFVDTFTVKKSTTVKNVNRNTVNDPVGYYNNIFEDYTITDKEGVDRSGNYILTFDDDCGIITIIPRSIIVTSLDAKKEYDSDPLTKKDYKLTSGTLVSDHVITNTYTKSITIVAKVDNEFTTTISGAEGDVTYNYDITRKYGILEVTPVPVFLAVFEQRKVCSGKAYSVEFYCEDQPGRDDIIVSGASISHRLSIKAPGSITMSEVERYKKDIICNVTKTLEDDRVISVPYGCYEVYAFESYGMTDVVVISKLSIVVRAEDADAVYDPENPLEHHKYFIPDGYELLDGHVIVYVEYSGSVWGNENEITSGSNDILYVTIRDKNGQGSDVTDVYYNIQYVSGTLTVYPNEESMARGS